MCPERELLSAYYDGEIPSPWREKLESHLAGCASCAEYIAELGRVSGLLGSLPEPVVSAQEHAGRKSEILARLPWPRRKPLWRRKVALSLPAAVAAGAAIMLFGMSLSLALRLPPVNPVPAVAGMQMSLLNVGPIDVTAQVRDLKNLLKMLNSEKSGRELVIQLPEQPLFRMDGEPVFIRADETRRDF